MPTRATSSTSTPKQTPRETAEAIESFLGVHTDALVLEDGKVLFDLSPENPSEAKWSISGEHGACTLHLWSAERNLVRRVLAATERGGRLSISTQRMGHAQPKLLEVCTRQERRLPSTREAARQRYLKVLERVLAREFAPWTPTGFRTAMDLERSFGPAYARGSLVKGRDAWAVIGVGEHENANIIDGVLTLGVLWLHECRTRAGGRRLYTGLRVVVPQGQAALTQARLRWMHTGAAQWELYELQQGEETLTARDPADQGNLRTALVHRPDEARARERFEAAVEAVKALVPTGAWARVEQHLRSPTELVFQLHGLPFARAKVHLEEASFRHRVEVTVGAGAAECMLNAATREMAAEHVAELFRRRQAQPEAMDYGNRGLHMQELSQQRRIGSGVLGQAHRRTLPRQHHPANVPPAAQDPLYRAAPERWLESVLRADLVPLTRHLALATAKRRERVEDDLERHDENFGNRAKAVENAKPADPAVSRLIPRLDPKHVYTQVPAIAGASDHGLLDMLGVTEDGRLAVIELKTDDDLHFALQGLDYWVRVREHHRASADRGTGLGEFQRHGYFAEIELSEQAPRLYLVGPALHIHPATETVLRYFSPEVEWHLLALDERWRQRVRVVWRKSSAS